MAAAQTRVLFHPPQDPDWIYRMVGAVSEEPPLEYSKWLGHRITQIFALSPFQIELPRVTKGAIKSRSDEEELARLDRSLARAQEEYDRDVRRRELVCAVEGIHSCSIPYDPAKCIRSTGILKDTTRYGYAIHPGPRPYNEDAVWVEERSVTIGGKQEPLGMFVLCDGHASFGKGNLAIEFLREHLGDALQAQIEAWMHPAYSPAHMRRLLKRLFIPLEKEAVHRKIQDGTTVTLGLSLLGKFWTVQLGDSGAEFQAEGGGTAVPLTESADLTAPHYCKGVIQRGGVVVLESSHRLSSVTLVGRILHREGESVNWGINMARSFGDATSVGKCAIPKITCIDVSEGGTIALFSDGLTCNNSREELSAWIRIELLFGRGPLLSNIAEDILLNAYLGGSWDNLSVLLIRLPRKEG